MDDNTLWYYAYGITRQRAGWVLLSKRPHLCNDGVRYFAMLRLTRP